MPIYEFYCSGCHTLLNFYSATVDTERRPACPHCGRPELERRPARFATLRHAGGGEAEPPGPFDEARMEQAFETLVPELEAAEASEDPRQMGRLMRRFGELAGMDLGPEMESVLSRLEAGEDPEALEGELERLESADDPAAETLHRLGTRVRHRPPKIDEELHFL